MQARRIAIFLPTTLAVCCLFALALPHPAAAQEKAQVNQQISYQIGAGTLDSVLNKFATQSRLQVVYSPELVAGKTSAGLTGHYAPQQALATLLKGKGITWDAVSQSMYVLRAEVATDTKPSRQEKRSRSEPVQDKAGGESKHATDLPDVVVVGSRLATSPVESAMPIKVITREDIDRSGAGNIAQALTYLSEVSLNNTGDREIGGTGISGSDSNTNSSTVQMRGLPRGTTLVLINGRRAGDSAMFSMSGQFDLSTIPLSLVDRIEVLPAGASAVYGGDGLAGVINVVLRRDAQGSEFRIRRSVGDGYDRDTLSAMWGKAWDRGNLTVAASWSRNTALLSGERSLTANQDFRRFGGRDLRPAGVGSYPATVYSLDGCPAIGHCFFVPLDTRGPLPGLNSPVATVPLGGDGLNLLPSDFVATQGQVNKTSLDLHLMSAEQNRGISVSGRLELSPEFELLAELGYTKRTVPARQLGFFTSYGEYGLTRVEADNPYNPFGVPVGIDFRYADTGLYTSFEQEYMRGLLGMRGKLGRFDWEITATQSRDKAGSKGALFWDNEKINAALSSSDPAAPFNPFVSDGSAPASREFIASLLETDLNHGTSSRGDVWTGFIRGPIFTIPAGEVQALLGVERQRQEIRLNTNTPTLVTGYINGVVTGNAAFAEVRLPLLSPRPGSSRNRIAVTGALRRETSDRFEGHVQTKTLGLEAWATEKLLFRATYSTAMRPLLSYAAVQGVEPELDFFFDPALPDGYQIVSVLRGGGIPPELRPEHSTTVTMGLLYRPSADWNLSLTHWDTKFRDQITFISAQTLYDNEQYFPDRVVRDPVTGLVTLLDLRAINQSRYDSAGVDVAIDGYLPTRIGDFSAGLSASYTYKHETQLAADSPSENNVAVRRDDGWAPRWKVVPRMNWQPRDGYNFMLAGRFVSSYLDSVPFAIGPNAGKFQELGKVWIVDFNADIALGKLLKRTTWIGDTRLTFGATNLLDKQPEFCAGCGIRGYDTSVYDIVGRTYYAELRLNY